jgi:DNA-binding transcriptional ArsR family regulator
MALFVLHKDFTVPRLTSPPLTRKIRNNMVTHSARPNPQTLRIYRAIADPTRRAILDKLRSGPVPVNAIAEGFRQSRPAVSRHLRVLRSARLVAVRHSGREHRYYLEAAPLKSVAEWLEEYRVFWQTNLLSLKHHLESEKHA